MQETVQSNSIKLALEITACFQTTYYNLPPTRLAPCPPGNCNVYAQFSKLSLLLYLCRQRAIMSWLHSHVGRRANFWWHPTTGPIFPNMSLDWHALLSTRCSTGTYQRQSLDLKLQRMVRHRSFEWVLQRTRSISLHMSLTKALAKPPHWQSQSAIFLRTWAVGQYCKECQAPLYLLFYRWHA